MTQSGSLSSYDAMTPSNGILTKARLRVSKEDVLAAKTIRIVPTTFSADAAQAPFSPAQRKLVTNVIDRTMCIGLSDRFKVVALSEPADLTVQAVITHAAPTDEVAAGVSKVASIVPRVLSAGAPVPVPRLPIGLGSLSLEAEARSETGAQEAAMIWARGADSMTTNPTVSTASDAYALAKEFGADFSRFLITGASPFNRLPAIPTLEKIGSALGAKPKNPVCETFGRSPGLTGMIGDRIGLPPEWTDKGAAGGQTGDGASAEKSRLSPVE
jgi:hypothetical protein